jgi:hypothetical protein
MRQAVNLLHCYRHPSTGVSTVRPSTRIDFEPNNSLWVSALEHMNYFVSAKRDRVAALVPGSPLVAALQPNSLLS